MILEFGASMIIDRPVYGLLRRRSVTKWLMIVLVPNSSIIIRISELIVQNFAFEKVIKSNLLRNLDIDDDHGSTPGDSNFGLK